MHQEQAFNDSLNALSKFFVGDKTLQQTLDGVAEATTVALPRAKFVGITMMANGRPQTAVFTHLASPEIDQAQNDAESGPCLDAFRTGDVQRIDSVRGERRWPEFKQAKGIIISTMRCTPDQAFAILTKQSQQQNRRQSIRTRAATQYLDRDGASTSTR